MDLGADYSLSAYPNTDPAVVHTVRSERRIPESLLRSSGTSNVYVFFAPSSGMMDPVVFKVDSQTSKIAQIQDEVSSTFNLVVDDLAKCCHVARKTIYNWRGDVGASSRRRKGLDRLFILSIAARDWRNSGFVSPGDYLREPMLNNASLMDLLVADDIDQEAIQFLGARLTMGQLDSFDITDPFV